MPAARPIEERFWEKVDQSGECWLWTSTTRKVPRDKTYRGVFNVNGRARTAYQVAWELIYGPIPSGQGVCHSCDNGLCVRPDHLFLGTQQDNIDDAKRKGRMRNGAEINHGVNHYKTILTLGQVREVLESTESNTNLGRKFGVSRTTIYRIRAGKNWQRELQKEFSGQIPESKRQPYQFRNGNSCKHGHVLTQENTYFNRDNYPVCKACKNASYRKKYHERKQEMGYLF